VLTGIFQPLAFESYTARRMLLRSLLSRNWVTEFHSTLVMIAARPSSSSNGSAWSCRDTMPFFMARAFWLPLATRTC